MKALDDMVAEWQKGEWVMINPLTKKPLEWRSFLALHGANELELEPYSYFYDKALKGLNDSIHYDVSPVFFVHWINEILLYNMLQARENARLKILEKITPDMDKKQVSKIHKESDRVYDEFEQKYYGALKNYE